MSIEPAAMPILNRRQMLRRLSGGFGMLGLASMLGPRALGAGAAAGQAGPHFPARAKRAIFLFMNGGPSQFDTFDPKPALKKHEGKQPGGEFFKKPDPTGFMPSPFSFARYGQSGIEVSETLPHLARVIDNCCIVRSVKADVPNHEPGMIQMHTGNIQPIRPSLGSWLLYGLGSANQNLPGYVALRPSPKIVVGPALWGNSFLPAEFQGTSVFTTDLRVHKLLAHIRNPKWSLAEQRQQLDLLGQLNRLHLDQHPGENALEAHIQSMETAYHMQTAAMDAFDLNREPASMRELYGDTPFAQSCLLARRLVESGVRFVTVYYVTDNIQPWDTHANHNNLHRRLCEDSDQATAALISDLKDRGMLEDTLVIWGGEFGRTPYAEKREGQRVGRDHQTSAFTFLLAGGGVKPGSVYGATDEFGLQVVENPVHVHDLHATILHLMGLDHERLTFRYGGRDFRLSDVDGQVARGILA